MLSDPVGDLGTGGALRLSLVPTGLGCRETRRHCRRQLEQILSHRRGDRRYLVEMVVVGGGRSEGRRGGAIRSLLIGDGRLQAVCLPTAAG